MITADVIQQLDRLTGPGSQAEVNAGFGEMSDEDMLKLAADYMPAVGKVAGKVGKGIGKVLGSIFGGGGGGGGGGPSQAEVDAAYQRKKAAEGAAKTQQTMLYAGLAVGGVALLGIGLAVALK